MPKLYTKTGDDGQTSLFDGSRVAKNHSRVEAYGTLDELNAHLGLAVALVDRNLAAQALHELLQNITQVQNELFTLGAELATPTASDANRHIPHLGDTAIKRLESYIDQADATVSPLAGFILPGGHPLAAQLHVCRTVCRRAERLVSDLMQDHTADDRVLIYLNRLGDLLFAWARLANYLHKVEDVLWIKPDKN